MRYPSPSSSSASKRMISWRLGFCVLLGIWGAAVCSAAAPSVYSDKEVRQGFRDNRVIAKPKAGTAAAAEAAEKAEGYSVRARYARFGNLAVLGLASGDTVAAAVKRLAATGRYDYVEPDVIRRAVAIPDDPRFSSQWALSNTGLNGGIAGDDIHAEAGWDVQAGAPGVIVGMLDSGALLTHEDLVGNLWVNPTGGGERVSLGSVVDTDSLNGLNAVAGTGAPADDVGHGTHTSGIVGAVGNNGLGVSGVAWKVQLMELKFLDSSGSGSTSDELPCIDYAIKNGVGVINASFGSTSFSQAEMDAIIEAGNAGIVFVCAAGNSAENVDISRFFPADYPVDNIICVGASDNRDRPVYFSDYGSGSVEIFAPGENILSTWNSGNSDYEYNSGTSMAAPMVSGAVALLKAHFPSDTYRQTINRILNCADPKASLAGLCQTGGRLNLAAALTTAASTAPNALFANRTVLVGLDPYTRSNNTFTPQSPEAGTPALGGTHSLWWQWTAPENATVEIDTSGTSGGTSFEGGSTYATLLGVYTGSALGSLATVATNGTYGTEPIQGLSAKVPYSRVSFHAAAGTTYQILVQSQASTTGLTVLAINTKPDNDSISLPTALSGPSASLLDANVNATLENGEPHILGDAGGHSLWYAWTAPKTGPAEASAYSYDFNPEVAVYTGTSYSNLTLVASAASTGMTGTSTLTSSCFAPFSAVAGTTYLICVDGKTATDTGEFTVSVDDALWQYMTGDAVTCSPSVGADGTVYAGSDDESFYAITPQGTLKWKFTVGGYFDTSAAAVAADGTVYAGDSAGVLHAFNSDGTTKWNYTIPAPAAGSGLDNALSSSPSLGADGTLYIHADDGNLYSISPAGSLNWTSAVPGASYAAPTIAPGGTIYVGTDGGLFYAINPADGSKKWTYNTPVSGDGIYTAASVDAAGNVYSATLSGYVYSLDPNGNQRWAFTAGDAVTSAPAIASGSVYFGSYDGNLYSLSAASGTLNWKYTLGNQVRASAPAIDANGVIYIGCYDHTIYAVSPEGTLVRTYATSDWVRSSPLIANNTLYIGSNDHKIYAFSLGVGQAKADWPMYQYDASRSGRSEVSITAQPQAQTVAVGGSATLSVAATGSGALSYQWYLDGVPIAGAVGPAYTVAAAALTDAGSYTVQVSGAAGGVTSAAAVLTVSGTPTARLVNISTRAQVGTASNLLIPGFVISGAGTETLLIRADGPSLSQFGVTGVLAQPSLSVFNSTGTVIASNTGWGTSANPGQLSSTAAAVGAFAFASGSADCALIVSLPAGAYTVQVSGVNNTTGIALAEIYEVSSTGTRLANISTRAQVGTGAGILIPGFVIAGSGSEQVLVRGDGPGLAQFGVTGLLAQPSISVFDAKSDLIASNTGWETNPFPGQISSVGAQVGAFTLVADSADSALVTSLSPGAYTLQVSGAGGTTGDALAEVYEVP